MQSNAAAPRASPMQCSIGVDMRNVERKGSRSALHPFIRVFRQGIGAALGSYDLKQELVG